LGELADAVVEVIPDEVELEPLSSAYLLAGHDRAAEQNYQMLRQYAKWTPVPIAQIILRFLVSPVEIVGKRRVEASTGEERTISPRRWLAVPALPINTNDPGWAGLPFDWLPGRTTAGVLFMLPAM